MSGYAEQQPTDFMSTMEIVDHFIDNGFIRYSGFEGFYAVNVEHYRPGMFNPQVWDRAMPSRRAA